jgi:polar amino acid transport system substrate-binding protein
LIIRLVRNLSFSLREDSLNWLAQSFTLLAVSGLAALAQPATADTLANIKAKGEIVVGTKSDYPPYGFRDKDGQIVGIEPDLAADLAKRLGVKLRLEPVLSSNRIQMLQDGKIDLLIATLSITDERRAIISFVEPPYYASGIAGLVRPQVGIRSEADLKEKSVCAIKGNFFNNDLQAKYVQKELVIVKDVPEAEQALLKGTCTILVFDDTLLRSLKKYDAQKWQDYDLVDFTEVDPLPWGIAMRLDDGMSAYSKLISAAVIDWHSKGMLIELEKKWLGSNTPWVIGVNQKYKQRPR